jgi:uncharacterized protein (DUF433 family)
MYQEEQPTYFQRIVRNPEIMVGKPVVKGTRIPVERVLAHLAHNPDLTDLLAAYPELTAEDVKACLAYADATIERNDARARSRTARHTAHLSSFSLTKVRMPAS